MKFIVRKLHGTNGFTSMFFLITLGVCSAINVPLLKVMEEGYVEEGQVPFNQVVTFPPQWNRKDFSLCLWIFPYRLLNSNSILSLFPFPLLNLIFIEGEFIVTLSTCVFATNIHPTIREWTHICFTLSQGGNVYVDGEKRATRKCTINLRIDSKLNDTSVTVGSSQRISIPLSGRMADIRIFWRLLLDEEVRNISNILDFPFDYQPIPSEELFEPQLSTFVEVSAINRDDLLSSYIPYTLIYIEEVGPFKDAEQTCKNRQSLLPDLDIHGNETIIELIYRFTLVSRIAISNFWLANKDFDACLSGGYLSRVLNLEITKENCDNSLMNYFCIIEKEKSFKLIGFREKNIEMFPVPNQVGVFESPENLKLYLGNSYTFLKDVTLNHIFYYSYTSKTNSLIGRHKWYYEEGNIFAKEITLTGCGANEFTCSDGSCIDISLACDLQMNCRDKSDEGYCDLAISPSRFYDKRLPPSFVTENTTELSLAFQISRIIDVSSEDNTIDLSVLIKVSWFDHRLDFKFLKLNQSLTIENKYSSLFWQPDIKVSGAVSSYENNLSFKVNPGKMRATAVKKGFKKYYESYEAIFYKGKDVKLETENLVILPVNCKVNFFYFPFDNQTCEFGLKLQNEFVDDIEWSRSNQSVTLGDLVNLALYDILNFVHYQSHPKQITISLVIARKYGAYILNTFLPCVVLEVIGLLTHFLPLDDYNDRVTVTLSCLIVMATLFSQVNSSLPKSAEPKLIDIWMFIHILVLVFVFIVHIVVVYYEDERIAFGEVPIRLFGRRTVSVTHSNKGSMASNSGNKTAWQPPTLKSSIPDPTNHKGRRANRAGFMCCLFTYLGFLVLFFLLVTKTI